MPERGLMPLVMHRAADEDTALDWLHLASLGRGAVDQIQVPAAPPHAMGDELGHFSPVWPSLVP